MRSVRLRGLDALTNQKSRGSLIPRLFLRVYRLLMNFSIRSNPSFRSASEYQYLRRMNPSVPKWMPGMTPTRPSFSIRVQKVLESMPNFRMSTNM